MPAPQMSSPLHARAFPPTDVTHPTLPLQGLTILVVEDSRYAAEAMRLMCQRSGARLRRAESVGYARAHLRVYRPDVVIVDLSLPDEPGTDLIGELTFGTKDKPAFDGLVLGCSGDPGNREAAIKAGAAGFLAKPLDRLEGFQKAILCHLPDLNATNPGDWQPVLIPDRQALHDDLHHAVSLLDHTEQIGYVADFLHSLARSTHDPVLEAATFAARDDRTARERLTKMLVQRLRNAPSPFAPGVVSLG